MKVFTEQVNKELDTYLSLFSHGARRHAYATIADQAYRLNAKQLIDLLIQHLGLNEMTIRYHLKLMKDANMIIATGGGHNVRYSINPVTARRVQALLGIAQELVGSYEGVKAR